MEACDDDALYCNIALHLLLGAMRVEENKSIC